jgi:AcrR family transcriptional regulator
VSSQPRLGRKAYFQAAFAILAARGPEALTIAALCTRLRVTKGSFYHHFSGMPDFVDALLRDWEEAFQAMVDETAGISDPVHRLEVTARHILAMPHETESALRAWGFSNPAVGAAVRRMDRAREQTYTASLAMVIDDPLRCQLLAHMGVSLLIGLQQRERPMDRERLLRINLEWLQTNIGVNVEVVHPGGEPTVRIVAGSLPGRARQRSAS